MLKNKTGKVKLLTQIQNIRKTILPTQMPQPIPKTCLSISSMKHPHVKPVSFVPTSPLYTSQPAVRLGELSQYQLRHREPLDSFMMMTQILSQQQTCLPEGFPVYHAFKRQHNRSIDHDKTAISAYQVGKALLFKILLICSTNEVPTNIHH